MIDILVLLDSTIFLLDPILFLHTIFLYYLCKYCAENAFFLLHFANIQSLCNVFATQSLWTCLYNSCSADLFVVMCFYCSYNSTRDRYSDGSVFILSFLFPTFSVYLSASPFYIMIV